MKRPAKKNINVLAAIGAGVLGIVAGVAGMFLSKEENRAKVKAEVSKAVRKGKVEIKKAKKKLSKRR